MGHNPTGGVGSTKWTCENPYRTKKWVVGWSDTHNCYIIQRTEDLFKTGAINWEADKDYKFCPKGEGFTGACRRAARVYGKNRKNTPTKAPHTHAVKVEAKKLGLKPSQTKALTKHIEAEVKQVHDTLLEDMVIGLVRLGHEDLARNIIRVSKKGAQA